MTDGLVIGSHLSSSKGYLAMGKTAREIGANTFQFFTRNPRGGRAKEIDADDVAAFHAFAKENGIGRILAHAPYTLNACSADGRVREFAMETMADDLKRMEWTPGNCYNFHPGSHVGQGMETGIGLIAAQLNALITPEQTTTVLLETMAGKGSEIGGSFEELKAIIDKVRLKDKIGVCMDTCHVHDAGYDIAGNLNGVLSRFDDIIGLQYLKALHINDSKNPVGAHKDRHDVIGAGHIGKDAFKKILTCPRLQGLPFVLETPQENLAGYGKEIKMLREMI